MKDGEDLIDELELDVEETEGTEETAGDESFVDSRPEAIDADVDVDGSLLLVTSTSLLL